MDADVLFGSDSEDDVSSEGSSTKILTLSSLLIDEATGKRRTVHPASRGVALWPDGENRFAPKYVGPLVLDQTLGGDVGGERGFKAAVAMAPGTLLLAESPVVLWSDIGIEDGRGGEGLVPFEVRVLQGCLARADAADLIAAMAPLYPVRIEDYADLSEVELLRQDESICKWIAELPRSVVAIGADEALRLILALRSNAFASGLYPYFAMSVFSTMR